MAIIKKNQEWETGGGRGGSLQADRLSGRTRKPESSANCQTKAGNRQPNDGLDLPDIDAEEFWKAADESKKRREEQRRARRRRFSIEEVQDWDPSRKEAARDKLRKLYGYPPYDGPSNICRGDGYFAQSIVRDYDVEIEDLAFALGMGPGGSHRPPSPCPHCGRR